MFSSKSAASYSGTINSYTDSENQQLAEELYKPVIGNFKNVKYMHLLKATFGVLI